MSPRTSTAPLKGANLCTCHHRHPSMICYGPCCELPMSLTRLRALVQIRKGPHALPKPPKQRSFVRPSLPRLARRCNLCSTWAVGDELCYRFDCPRILEAPVLSGFRVPTCFRMLRALCACSCDTKTKKLSAIPSQPICKWPRYKHKSVLHHSGWLNRCSKIFLSLCLNCTCCYDETS